MPTKRIDIKLVDISLSSSCTYDLKTTVQRDTRASIHRIFPGLKANQDNSTVTLAVTGGGDNDRRQELRHFVQ